MRIAIIVNRGMRQDGQVPSPAEVIAWATTSGARALSRDDLGSLEVGKKADLAVVHLDRPHMVPPLDVVFSLVHYAQASDVESVMVDGEWVMRDGRVLTMDEEAVMEAAQEAAVGVWRRLRDSWPGLTVPANLNI